jgi:hypothetical protein
MKLSRATLLAAITASAAYAWTTNHNGPRYERKQRLGILDTHHLAKGLSVASISPYKTHVRPHDEYNDDWSLIYDMMESMTMDAWG